MSKKETGLSNYSFKKSYTPPFMPEDYLKNVRKHVEEGKKSKYRNKKFEKILSKTQDELKDYCIAVLQTYGYSQIVSRGYVYGKGEIPVLLVAHLDTVHKETPVDFIYKDEFLTSPQGIGGDDRCGVRLILNIIRERKCHVLFCEDEEIGCVGAELFAESDTAKKLKESGEINYIIELDRRGTDDCVFYDCENEDFIKFIESTGYFKTNYGSCSDISYVAPKLGVAAVNLSSGYFSEHHIEEYINLKAMDEIETQILKLIDTPCEKPFEYISYLKKCSGYGYGYDYRKGSEYSYWGSLYGDLKRYDDYCDDYSIPDENRESSTEITDDYRIRPQTSTVALTTYEENVESYFYHIYFDDVDGKRKVAEVNAINSDEAIGLFLQYFDYLTAADIVDYYEF